MTIWKGLVRVWLLLLTGGVVLAVAKPTRLAAHRPGLRSTHSSTKTRARVR